MSREKTRVEESGLDEDEVIAGFLDRAAVKTAQKLRSKGYYDEAGAPISEGKESIILFAFRGDEPRILKVHRVETSRFRHMTDYLRGDQRFKKERLHNRRRVVYAWTKKEYSNLKRAARNGVRCPEAYAYENNFLVLQMVGDDGPAPLLKDVDLESELSNPEDGGPQKLEDPEAVLDELIEQYRRLYHGAGLVHADFSEYNTLWHDGEPWIIDFAQAVVHSHPKAEEFFERDMVNLANYFHRNYGLDVDEETLIERVLEKRA